MLNRDGIEVENQVGSGPWHLTGDGYLTPQTLGIMKEAVQLSSQHVTDDKAVSGATSFGDLAAKVWAYAPKLTSASEAKVKGLIAAYVNPESDLLLTAAAEIVAREVDNLVKLLIDKKALKEI